jgi:multiple sugar transport system permease protein
LGLLNTMVGMVAPFCLMQGFSVFFLRQFFLSIPRDLEEAALLDGASYTYIFTHVVLPLSITPLATIAMLTGINMWNEFFWPYLVAKDEAQQVLPVALQTFKSQTAQGQPDWTGLMAATAITVMPTILLLVAMGRRVVESVQFSGGK